MNEVFKFDEIRGFEILFGLINFSIHEIHTAFTSTEAQCLNKLFNFIQRYLMNSIKIFLSMNNQS